MWFKTCAVLTSSETFHTVQGIEFSSLYVVRGDPALCELPEAEALLPSNPGWASPRPGASARPRWRAADLQKHLTPSPAPDSDQSLFWASIWPVTVPRRGSEAERCHLTCSLPFASLAASWLTGVAGHAWLNGHSSWTDGRTWDRQISSHRCVSAGVWTVHRNERTSSHSLSSCSWKVFPLCVFSHGPSGGNF